MRRLHQAAILTLMLAAGTLAALATPVHAPKSALAGIPTAGATRATDIDPDAIAALNKMGTYLRSLQAFQVKASTSNDEVLEDGQKIEFDTAVDLLARRPDRLRLEVNGDLQDRLYLYNGKTFTLWAQRVNYYATVPAPPTIAELIDQLDEKFGIDVPLVDLFYWGTERSSVGTIKAAMDVGPSQVEGTTCEVYAFRQEGLDWQVWIQAGDYPLPRKLVLTTLNDEARPRYSSVLTWNLAPSFDDSTFEFDPPKDAQKIVFGEANTPSGGGKP